MPVPLDIALGSPLAQERQDAINAVKAECPTLKDNTSGFWERVSRVQSICAHGAVTPHEAAEALDVVANHMRPVGEYGHHEIPDDGINALVQEIALALRDARTEL